MSGVGDELDRSLRHFRVRGGGPKAPGDGDVGAQSLPAAPQDDGVARLEAEPRRVGGHVGTGLVDDAHHAQGDADPADPEALLHGPHPRHLADGVPERGDLLQSGGHALDARLVERETVQGGRGEPGRVPVLEVLRVLPEDRGGVRPNRRRHGAERPVLVLRPRRGEDPRRGPRPLPHACQFPLCAHFDLHQLNLRRRLLRTIPIPGPGCCGAPLPRNRRRPGPRRSRPSAGPGSCARPRRRSC